MNEDMKSTIRIIKSLENSVILIDEVKHVMKKQEYGFFAPLLAIMAASMVTPAASSLVKAIFAKGVKRTGRGYYNNNNMNYMDKNF